MMRRLLDLALLILILAGGFMAWTTGRERTRLQADFARLARLTGDLPIGDPSKVHVLALPTGDPMHYAWRVYVPANVNFRRQTTTGFSGAALSSTSQDFITRVRFREDQGLLHVYDHYAGGSSRGSLGEKSLADLLRGRWDKLQVEQLGSSGVAMLDPDEPAVLLQVTLPEAVQAEALAKLSPSSNQAFNPVLFQIEIGPEKPKTPAKPAGK